MSDSTTSPTFLYIIQAGNGPIKIGISSNLKLRFDDLQHANHETLTLLYNLRCPSQGAAITIEFALHAKYREYRIRSEWFSVNPEVVIKDIEFARSVSEAIMDTSVEMTTVSSKVPNPKQPKQTALDYLALHPDETFTVRGLAEKAGVSKDAAHKALTAKKGYVNGHSQDEGRVQ